MKTLILYCSQLKVTSTSSLNYHDYTLQPYRVLLSSRGSSGLEYRHALYKTGILYNIIIIYSI